MDLTSLGSRLRRWATPRPLLVSAAGAHRCRWAVERQLRLRGWASAACPAAADVLVICGEPGPRLTEAIERVWDQLPAPRVRVRVVDPAVAGTRLDAARASLNDGFREPDVHRPHAPDAGGDEMPAGLDMAERGADRDGLTLDRLHPVLGPVLPHWPPGLQLRLTMQGDVLQDVQAELLEEPAPAAVEEERVLALDGLAGLLAVLGWDAAAGTARYLRDAHLGGHPVPVDRFARRLHRSRSLRWSTDGLGACDHAGLGRDVTARCRHRLAVAAGAAEPARLPLVDVLGLLPDLLRGCEVATARIIVASLPWEFTTSPIAVAHG